MKLVRSNTSGELDKEWKTNLTQHKNTIFKQAKKPLSENIVSEQLWNTLEYSLKRRQCSSPTPRERMVKGEFSICDNFLPIPRVWNIVVFTRKNEASGVQGYTRFDSNEPWSPTPACKHWSHTTPSAWPATVALSLIDYGRKLWKHLWTGESQQDHLCVSQNVVTQPALCSRGDGACTPLLLCTNLFKTLKL